ncbi:serine hydrolase domain-containing protein [Streptomyces sp. NPDC003090]|uniref:serine hydrolase domain-containing protein n=1 Tax=Streptomyces sp. NPDC003090 TaxID=3154274 RepID=UPI0038271D83
MRIRLVLCGCVAALSVSATAVAAVPLPDGPGAAAAGGAGAVRAGTFGAGAVGADASAGFDTERLGAAMDAVHEAGMPGVYGEVRGEGRVWRGASGVADLATGRPVTPDMRQRVGSITKTFTAAAVMRQVERGRIELDAPIGRYLPELVPGERGRRITVRMLLNHTSGIPDYIPYAFPSLQGFPTDPDVSARSLEDNRFRQFRPAELIEMGLSAPPAGEPGARPGVYSNTNYEILGQLLERVTGMGAEEYITRDVILRAGLRHTAFPDGPRIKGPHPRMYEGLWGLLDPPRDYSVYNMSWVTMGAGLVSTMGDLNRFYAALLDGRIVSPSSLAEMKRTLPVQALDGSVIEYGLGLHKVVTPCGTFWGHDGSAWGAGTVSLTRADGGRQMSVAVNLARWRAPGAAGHDPIDAALTALYDEAMCGDGVAGAGKGGSSRDAADVLLPAGVVGSRPPSPVGGAVRED